MVPGCSAPPARRDATGRLPSAAKRAAVDVTGVVFVVRRLDGAWLDAAVALCRGFELMEVVDGCWVCEKPGAEIVRFDVSSDRRLADPILRHVGLEGAADLSAALRAYVESVVGREIILPVGTSICASCLPRTIE